MPKAWSKKDERQYEHIKESEKEQGRSADRSKEIAAATVNKQRKKEGRTKEQKSSKSGSKSRAKSGSKSRANSSSKSRSKSGSKSRSKSRSRSR